MAKRQQRGGGSKAPNVKEQRARLSAKKPIEHYEHPDKKRVNNPPVGLVTPETDPEAGKKTYRYDPHLDPALQFDSGRGTGQAAEIERIIEDGLAAASVGEARAALAALKKRRQPYLTWAGKAERTTFQVPTVSLHVHERIDPKAIIQAVRAKNAGRHIEQLGLFERPGENPPLREAIDFYKHPHGWSNRLIAGDSLLVMNSLLEKEGMAGKVQMIYIDPPYGIRYGSNFQPFVNKRDVKDGKDEDLTQEPEMIRAFRDTWELGIHSYLTYLRDRLLLVRELLSDSGSCFIQIGDENVNLIRGVMDEVFGRENFFAQINFRSKSPLGQKGLAQVYDYLVWYCKDGEKAKFRPLFREQPLESEPEFCFLDEGGGRFRKIQPSEISSLTREEKARIFKRSDLRSSGYTPTCMFEFELDGQPFKPLGRKSWRTNREGVETLKAKHRLFVLGSSIYFRQYHSDFPFMQLENSWEDTAAGFSDPKVYVVQTHTKVVQRCLLMTTDPGDLVLDPTCGSGTTAYVAEQWGRRWITCDTSRVAITLAKQRLITAVYDYYELAHPEEGVGSGFRYKSVTHTTLGSLANNEPPQGEILYDQPYVDKNRARVSGPFTVEAVPAPTVRSLEDIEDDTAGERRLAVQADTSVARQGATLRHAEWRDELLKTGIRGKSGQIINFSRVEPLAGTRWLHADAETKSEKPERVVISFGPEHGPLEQRQVELAWEEARTLIPKPSIIVFAAFQFDPEAAKDIDELTKEKTGMTFLTVQMNADLLTEDLKKKRASNESFWLVGRPDVDLRQIKKGENKGRWEVEVRGFDYYNTRTGTIESGDTAKIAMWLLDTDYDGRSLYARQVFFPMADEDGGWARLARNLKAEIDPELIVAYRGTASLPFDPGPNKRVAVKVIDDRGIESLKIVGIR